MYTSCYQIPKKRDEQEDKPPVIRSKYYTREWKGSVPMKRRPPSLPNQLPLFSDFPITK